MKRMLIALAAVAFLAVAAAATAADVVVPATPIPPAIPPPPAPMKRALKTVPLYRLTAQQAAGLPTAIVENGQPGAIIDDGRPAPKLRLLTTPPPPAGNKPLFLVQGEWSFTAERRFQQLDRGGNRLLLSPDGTAEVFGAAGARLGSLQDPALARLYGELLKLTM